jgi:hypothetical protein
MDECPDCYGSGVDNGELCELCNGATSPEYRAHIARSNAVHNYMSRVDEAVECGDHWLDVDIDKAHDCYLAGMHALDCAIEVSQGLTLEDNPWKGTVFGHE